MTALHPVFTPTALDPAELDAITVGRQHLIKQIVDRLHSAAHTGTRTHTLLVGPRGSGKTHLLAVSIHRALQDPEVAERLAVAWIPEDALAIGSYTDLLVELISQLDGGSGRAARSLRRSGGNPELEQLLDRAAGGRTLVLVIENLDRVFSGIGHAGAAGLRGYVETLGHSVLLASTPLLFSGVRDREEPWFGSFNVDQLDDLSLAEGTEVMRRRAEARDDKQLATFVSSTEGQIRLKVIQTLAGGSPRLWHILAEAVSVPSLEQLIPAVEKLMDDLAPYYQQRLWELPPGEQKLVVELARQDGMQPVSELAEAAGVSERAAATSLGRLADARWVRKQKAAGGDQRRTWYELREPLLRHHLQFRENRGEPLRLIVEVLHHWYSAVEREQAFAAASPGSRAERAIALSFKLDPPRRYDLAWVNQDIGDLLIEARNWEHGVGRSALVGSPTLGAVVGSVANAALGRPDPSRQIVRIDAKLLGRVRALTLPPDDAEEVPATERLERMLGELADWSWTEPDRFVCRMLAAGWKGWSSASEAAALFAELAAEQVDPTTREALIVRDERAFWTGHASQPAVAADLYAELLIDCTKVLGPDHIDTFGSRFGVAFWTGMAGDASAARDLFSDLIRDATVALGFENPHVQRIHFQLAGWSARAGDLLQSKRVMTDEVARVTRDFGEAHPLTLQARASQAYLTSVSGDFAAGRDLAVSVIADSDKHLGSDHGLVKDFVRGLAREAIRQTDLHEQSMSAVRTNPIDAREAAPLEPLARAAYIVEQLTFAGPEDRVAWLAASELEPERPGSWLWTLARALDKEAEALLRLSPELREIAIETLDGETD